MSTRYNVAIVGRTLQSAHGSGVHLRPNRWRVG